MRVKVAIFQNALAGGFGRVSLLVFRVVQVPLLLSKLGVSEYGRWLVLSSFPMWLTLANLGFGIMASNEISMAMAAGNLPKARSMFSTSLALVGSIAVIGSIFAALVAPFIPWERFLGVSAGRHGELTAAVTYLAASVLVSFTAEAFGGRFRAARSAHVSMLINSLKPWLDLLAMIVVLRFSGRLDYLALGMLVATSIYLGAIQWLSWRSIPALSFSFREIHPSRFRDLFRKGIAFQAFPLGNALLFQGNLLVVQLILGPVAVALFGTARTLVRSINQLMELMSQIVWPELSHLLGAGDLARAARLHRLAVGASVASAGLSVVGLGFFGHTIYGWWTGKAISLPEHLLLLFLLPIPFNALWQTSSVVHVACNRHEGFAVRYLIGTSCAVFLCALLSHFYGINGAALSTLGADLILIPFVLKRSLELTGDSWIGFARGLRSEITSGLPRIWTQAVNRLK